MSSAHENNDIVNLSLGHRKDSWNDEDYWYVTVIFWNNLGAYLELKLRDSWMLSPHYDSNDSAKEELSRVFDELNELFGDDSTTRNAIELIKSNESVLEDFDHIFEGYIRYEEKLD